VVGNCRDHPSCQHHRPLGVRERAVARFGTSAGLGSRAPALPDTRLPGLPLFSDLSFPTFISLCGFGGMLSIRSAIRRVASSSFEVLAMRESEKAPSKIPEHLTPDEAVLYRIGEFIETFNEMEESLAHVLEKLIGVKASAIWFMWETPSDEKIKTVRRANNLYGPTDKSDDSLNAMLNRLRDIAEFRNRPLQTARVGGKYPWPCSVVKYSPAGVSL